MPQKGQRAPIGLAMICKNGEQTLPACLKSIRPFVEQIVVCVDELTTDKTTKIARKHGADIVAPIKVSDWHECEQHGRVLAQHFGRARNESFTYLDKGLPYWLWLDADDFVQGGEHLLDLCTTLPEEAVGVWLSYLYATVNNYAEATTVFDRERILRSSVGWRWDYRVHEVVIPDREHPKWHVDQRIRVVHQEGVHKTEASTTRNQLLLEIDWEEKPDDQRTAFYMANGFFAADKLPEAAHWYEVTTRIGTNPWELWQSYCYLSITYRRLGDLDQATQAAFCAIDAIPDYREGYYRLAEVYLAAGQFQKAIDWTTVGLEKHDPPRFVFVNPLDTKVNARVILSDAHAQLGHVAEARRQMEMAHAVASTEPMREAIAKYARMEHDAKIAQAFVDLAPILDDVALLDLYHQLPVGVRSFGRTRDVAVPAMLRRRETRYAA